MCFALTLGIFIQIRTVKESNSTVSQNYEENNLRAEVLKYKEKYAYPCSKDRHIFLLLPEFIIFNKEALT